MGARLSSAWARVGHHACCTVVSEAAVTTGIRCAQGTAAAGIRVVQVGRSLCEGVCIVVADIARRTREGSGQTSVECRGTCEGGRTGYCEAIADIDVVCGDHVVSDNHITCGFNLSCRNGTHFERPIDVYIFEVRSSSHRQSRQYDHGNLRLSRDGAADGLIKVIVVLYLSCNFCRAGGQVVNLTLEARDI